MSPKCPKCDGEGVVVGVLTIECHACEGTGKVLENICLICTGPGVASVESAILCDQCGGTGYTSHYQTNFRSAC